MSRERFLRFLEESRTEAVDVLDAKALHKARIAVTRLKNEIRKWLDKTPFNNAGTGESLMELRLRSPLCMSLFEKYSDEGVTIYIELTIDGNLLSSTPLVYWNTKLKKPTWEFVGSADSMIYDVVWSDPGQSRGRRLLPHFEWNEEHFFLFLIKWFRQNPVARLFHLTPEEQESVYDAENS